MYSKQINKYEKYSSDNVFPTWYLLTVFERKASGLGSVWGYSAHVAKTINWMMKDLILKIYTNFKK